MLLITSPPDPHMRNNCPSPVVPVLGLSPKWHNSRQPLHCQHWRYEAMTFWAARKRQESKASQRSCRPSGGLERYRGSAAIPRTPICPRDHPLWGDKLSLQWSSCRAFWHWQDKRVGWLEILLAKPEKRRWELCPRMWCLSDFECS